jgi:hypothetical protein
MYKDHFDPIWSEMYHLDIAINRHQKHKEKRSRFVRVSIYNDLVEKNRNEFLPHVTFLIGIGSLTYLKTPENLRILDLSRRTTQFLASTALYGVRLNLIPGFPNFQDLPTS